MSLRAASLVAAVLLAAPAGAQDNKVLLPYLSGAAGVDQTLIAQVDVGLRSEMGKVVGPRMVAGPPTPYPAGCGRGECARALAEQHGAAFVVLANLAYRDSTHRLQARLHDSSGAVVLEAERTFDRTPDFRELRGLAMQLLVPGDYTGSVMLSDRAREARVEIDRIPLAQDVLDKPIPLSVGTHTISVTYPGQPPRLHEVEVPFEEQVEVSLALKTATTDAGAPQPKPAPALWPGLVASGVAAAGVLTLAVASADLLFTTLWLAEWYSDERVFDRESVGASRRKWGVHIAGQVHDFGGMRRAQRNDYIVIAGAGAITAVSGVAAAVLLTDWALSQDAGADAE